MRQETPDILGELMGGKPIHQEHESNKAIKQDIAEAINAPAQLKEKTTYNLSKNVLNRLDDAWMEIRKLRGDKSVSKTEIVEQAIDDFLSKKQQSKFYGKRGSNKTIKQ